MASANFLSLASLVASGGVNFDGTDTFKGMLVTVAPTTVITTGDLDTWDFRDDVTNECADSDYTGYADAGHFAVTSSLGTVDATNNTVVLSLSATASPTYTSPVTISAVGAVIYKVVGTAATDNVICYVDFGGTVASTAGEYDVTLTADTMKIGIGAHA